MQVTRTENLPTKITLRIEAGATDLSSIKRHVLSHFSDVKVPGFRSGRVPTSVLEKHVDQAKLTNDFLEHAVNDLYRKAVEAEKLRPVGQPEIQIKKFVPYDQLEFEAGCEVIGPIKLADYKKIKLLKPKVSIASKDVDEVLARLQGQAAERKAVERAAKLGDEVVIDFAGSDEKGEPIAGTDSKDYPLVLGSKNFIPGFEEELIGLKTGQEKKFTVIFPKDYGVPALQNQKVEFKVKVSKVNELVKPGLDDELAKKVGPFSNLAELKADIKKQLASERQYQADRDYENRLVQAISEKSKVEIPKLLVDEQIMRAEEEEKRNLAYRGQTWAEHLKEEGLSEEQHRERQRPAATERIKASLVLSEIAEKEKLEVSPAELEGRVAELKLQYKDPAMQIELDKPESQQDIAARILTEKTLQILTDSSAKKES